MPCNYIRWVSIEFGKNTDFELVEKAILKAGGKVSGRYSKTTMFKFGQDRSVLVDRLQRTVKIKCQSPDQEQELTKQIKRGYAEQVVRQVAKRKMWNVEEERTAKRKKRLRLWK